MPRLWAIRSAAPNWSGMSQGNSSGRERPGPLKALPEADPAHGLDTTGDGGLDGAGGDQVGNQVVGLLGRAALAVDGGGGDLEGQAGQPGGAGHVGGLLARLGDAAADDLAHVAGVDAGALDELDLGGGWRLGGMEDRQPPVALADRRPDSFDDHWLGHG